MRRAVLFCARGTTVVAAGATTTALLGWALLLVVVATIHRLSTPGPAAVADSLTLLLAGLALVLLAWLTLGAVLALLACVPGAVGDVAARVAERLTPALARRLVAFIVGSATVGAVLPSTAAADPWRPSSPAVVALADPGFTPNLGSPGSAGVRLPPGPGFVPVDRAVSQTPAPDPGFVPGRPTVRSVPSLGALASGGVAKPDGLVVHRGDTLWSIAARDLGVDATDVEVARHWPRWYAANRQVIGDDPDALKPGQVLRPPARQAAP